MLRGRWFLGFLVSKFLVFVGFLVSKFLGFKISKLQRFTKCPFTLFFFEDIDPISKIFKMVLDVSSGIVGVRLRPSHQHADVRTHLQAKSGHVPSGRRIIRCSRSRHRGHGRPRVADMDALRWAGRVHARWHHRRCRSHCNSSTPRRGRRRGKG